MHMPTGLLAPTLHPSALAREPTADELPADLTSVTIDGSALFRADATFCPQAGRSGAGTTSFASFNFPTRLLRHFNNTLYIASNGGSNAFDSATSFAADTTWAVSAPWAP